MNSGLHIWKSECMIALSGIARLKFYWTLIIILQMASIVEHAL